jgi:dTDP-4-dehydrorhamnose 3,5-epimerase
MLDLVSSETKLKGVFILKPNVFNDERGFFFESYSKNRMKAAGFDIDFVQDNHSRSKKNVIRGLHFQDYRAPQIRLVRCTVGEIWDVVVDMRVGSPTLGQWMGFQLSADNRHQLLIPPEFAHGFAAISDVAEVQYKCSNHHKPEAERVLAWDDPRVGIVWPVRDGILSQKDRTNGASFEEYLSNAPFKYQETT